MISPKGNLNVLLQSLGLMLLITYTVKLPLWTGTCIDRLSCPSSCSEAPVGMSSINENTAAYNINRDIKNCL